MSYINSFNWTLKANILTTHHDLWCHSLKILDISRSILTPNPSNMQEGNMSGITLMVIAPCSLKHGHDLRDMFKGAYDWERIANDNIYIYIYMTIKTVLDFQFLRIIQITVALGTSILHMGNLLFLTCSTCKNHICNFSNEDRLKKEMGWKNKFVQIQLTKPTWTS